MLLDTHTLLWFLSDDSRLRASVKSDIENVDDVTVSIVSLWEIAIKLSIQKLELDFLFSELSDFLTQLEMRILPLSFADLEHYLSLPLHHRDPFDRMLASQAITNLLIVVSADAAFDAYPIQQLWV
ncbi:MAG: type II toxin-antitoxin system VapC family toxin [Spirulinaceae cyanobacterium RM2_2_10]|nr:type II toxin-antitoxin system VapC family toxin [Spirulinaceae cyanobacterium RM2_2_10]